MGKIIWIFWFVTINNLLIAQNFKLTYQLSFKPKIGDTTIVRESYFLKINTKAKSSIFGSDSYQDNSLNTTVVKDYSKNVISVVEQIYNQYYKTEENTLKNWNLLSDTKFILKYKCFAAKINFGGRNWLSWYTPDIPFPDGPYKFSGLPGVIMNISSEDGEYSFQLTDLQNTNEVWKYNISNIIFLDNKSKLILLKKSFLKDPIAEMRKQMSNNNSGYVGIASFNGVEITNKDREGFLLDKVNLWKATHDNPLEKGDTWVGN